MPDPAPTFDALRERQPELAEVEAAARAVEDRGGPYFCANDAWFSIRRRLDALLGAWRRPREESDDDARVLGDPRAHAAAVAALYPLLPPCRDCGCARFQPLRDEDLGERGSAAG